MTVTLSLALLERAYGRAFNNAQKTNAQSALDALTTYGQRFGLLQPHRTVQFLAQLMHESGGFIYDREIWGPTKAQKGYEGRKDLGNTQKGDGSKFRGHGPGQVTGRANHRAYTKWAKTIDPAAPNFEATPEKVNNDQWEGLSAIWYWDSGNPDGKSLNRLADRGDIENITRKWNGGLNGYEDRLRYFDRLALAFLGYAVNEMPRFQKAAGLKDTSGTSGPLTRAALHSALLRLTAPQHLSAAVATAPVVEEVAVEVKVPVEVEKPVVPASVEKEVKKKFNLFGWIGGLVSSGSLGALGLSGMNWQGIVAIAGALFVAAIFGLILRHWIIRAVKEIREGLAYVIAAMGILKTAIGLLNWDRVLGALIGGGIAWCIFVALNQAIWLPNAREEERQKLAAEALVKTIETLKAREKTNVEISASDAVALCQHFGLQDNDRTECLRRVAAASADPGDRRAHHDDGPAVR